jgi:hypothetical protein
MQQRKQEILRGLEAMRENLEAFADEMWDTIDHRDMATLASRFAAYKQYADAVKTFGELADQLESLVAGVPDAMPTPPPPPPPGPPHTLREDFTSKKPTYYDLRGQRSAAYAHWSDLYVGLCEQLARLNPTKFATLATDPHYLTKHGNRRFDVTNADMIRWKEIVPGVYANINISANSIRDMIRQLLPDFGLKVDDMAVYFAGV